MLFDKFVPYIGKEDAPRVVPNEFFPLSQADIYNAESRLGFVFPDQLKRFYNEIGYGFWCQGVDDERDTNNDNRILDPGSIANILRNRQHSHCPPEGFFEGDMPFLEVQMHLFLVMRPKTTSPNAVCVDGGRQIANDFVEFTEKLYHHAAYWWL